MYEKYVKRSLDLLLSIITLIAFSPLLLLLCVVIKLDSRGPILFKQKRVGINRSHFLILKFRTMQVGAPKDMPTHMMKDSKQYITRVGRFLRKTSLDELPQIFNIIKGEMSIVGPRPALWNQYDLLDERDRYRANDIVPGLTGWAQINGRDELEISEKAMLDGKYAYHLRQGGMNAFLFDIRCFFGSLINVLSAEGIVEGGAGKKQGSNMAQNSLKSIQKSVRNKQKKQRPKKSG